MKECKYCGTSYADNLSVCPNCGGAKTVTDEERIEESTFKRKEIENRERAVAAPQKQRKTIIGAMAAVVAIAIAIIVIVSINANKPLSNGMTKDEGEQVLADGIAYYDAGNYEAAISSLAKLPTDSKQYEKAQSILMKAKESYVVDIMERYDNYLLANQYEAAIQLVETALKVVPDPAFEGAFAEAYRYDILSKVDVYLANEEQGRAVALLRSAMETLPHDIDLQEAYASTFAEYKREVCEEAKDKAGSYAAEAKFDLAIETVQDALNEIENDAELITLKSEYEDAYADQVLAVADSIFNTDGYLAATQILNEGKDVLGSNSRINEAIEKYTPDVTIVDLDYYTGWPVNEHVILNDKDNLGNSYTQSISGFACYTTYRLDGEYSRIAGTLYQRYEERNGDPDYDGSQITITGDGKTLYASDKMDAGVDPIYFDVDLTGVIEMEIHYDLCGGGALGDCNLWK